MKKRQFSLTTVLAALLTLLVAVKTTGAQESAAVEDEDESFLNQSTEPEPAPEPEVPQEEAEATDEDQDASLEIDPKKRRDHAKQGFVSVMAGVGWHLVAPYDKNDPEKMCKAVPGGLTSEGAQEGEPVCTGRSVWHLDMLAGYGIIPGFEVFAIFRLGLESSPPGMNRPNTRQIGAGVKFYSPSEGLFKIGFGVAPLFDFSDHGSADIGYDFVIHIPIQAHFDIVRWFGVFAQVSPNISFVSEFRLEFTGGIGVQGRFP